MKRDVPISLADPMVHFYNEDVWKNLGELAGISNKFTALEIKAFYIVGLLYEIFQCVELLLQSEDAWETKYLPAFSLFASGIDLFGRCLAGNSTFDLNSNLAIGFYYLVNHSAVIPPKGISTPDQRKIVVVETNAAKYSISHLISIQNFSAHGQATNQNIPVLHVELLDSFPQKIGDSIETYWRGLQKEKELCERLGNARIDPYNNRIKPLTQIISRFSEGLAVSDLFYKLYWQIYR
jgi:hypothetical protein